MSTEYITLGDYMWLAIIEGVGDVCVYDGRARVETIV